MPLAARNLPLLAPGGGWRSSRAFATHERIGEAARAVGFAQVQVLAPGQEALLRAWSAALPAGRRTPLR
jgi:uroporphyrinogen-III synthase